MPGDNGRERFTMVPESVMRAKCHDGCLDLFAFLDFKQGSSGRPFTGVRALANELGWSVNRTYKHLEHLTAQGFITMEREGRQRVVFRVHNPARGVSRADTPVCVEQTQSVSGADTQVGVPSSLSVRSSASGSDASLPDDEPRVEEAKRDARATGNGDGRLGVCDVCGKRWAFGSCEHGGPELEVVS